MRRFSLLLLLCLWVLVGRASAQGLQVGLGESLDTSTGVYSPQAVLLLPPYFGLRVTQWKGLPLEEHYQVQNSQITQFNLELEQTLTEALWLIDYLHHGPARPMPFEFLTAYLGIGYASGPMRVRQTRYIADKGQLVQSMREESAPAKTGSLTLGLYGGERFINLDIGLRYLLSNYQTQEGSSSAKKLQFLLAITLAY